jgi:molybdenum cofactor cytidylyltransferase
LTVNVIGNFASKTMLSLVILAGGESSRMGSPKALLRIGNETFLQCIIRKGREAGVYSVIVVTGPDHGAISQLAPPEVVCVQNHHFRQGQVSSLQTGIRSVASDASGIIVWPVDQPLIRADTLVRLIDAFLDGRKSMVVPAYRQRKGHPVVYGKDAMQWALELKAGQTGKDLHQEHSGDRILVDVDDPGILIDIDTPEDYRKYITT